MVCALGTGLAGAPPADAQKKRPRLTAFQSCTGLVNYSRQHADTVVSSRPAMPPPRPVPAPAPQQQGGAEQQGGMAPAATSAPTSDARGGEDFSQTNVQEAGVDEPDIIKSDGRRMFVVRGNRLQVIGVAGDQAPRVLGSVELPPGGEHSLLLHGDKVLAFSRGYVDLPTPVPGESPPAPPPSDNVASSPAPGYSFSYGTTTLSLVDVSDSSAPRVTRTMTAEGGYIDARMTGSVARVVVDAPPRALRDPEPDAVATARAADWVPRGVWRRGRQGRRVPLRLANCDDISRPPNFSGLDALTVMTIDVDRGLMPIDSDAVLTSAETVYASKDNLYLATQRWTSTATTLLHKLDISKSDTTTYRGSGEVEGTLLNQFALSEHEGVLRAATTTFNQNGTESLVTTLTEREGKLIQLGRVGGLGRGERIYAVRFIGDQGYVVTFRQVDPLYTIDLRNPAAPRVVGELKIAGYSAYLHPIGDNLLIGVGQDATEQGRRTGTQLSLFDVSNPAQPTRLYQYKPDGFGSSEAEYDHHAFLWWPATNLAVIPLTIGGNDAVALGARIGRGGIAEVGRVKHPVDNGFAPVQRSLVVRDRLFTLSPAGLRTSRLDSLADVAWLPLQP